MALVNTFNSLTRDIYEPNFADNIFVKSAFWSEAYRHAKPVNGGKQYVAPIKTGKLGGGTYRLADDTLTLTTGEIASEVRFDWRHYYVPVQLSAINVDLNAQAGTDQIANVLDTYIWSAGETMRDSLLGTHVFGTAEDDTYNERIDGLYDLMQEEDTADGFGGYNGNSNYGEISVTDLTTWKAHIDRCTGSSGAWVPNECTVEVCRAMINEIVHGPNGCNELPHLAVTTPEVYQKLSREIFEKGLSQPVITRTGERLVKAGFQAFEIDNVPFIADEHAPDSTWDATVVCTNGYENVTGDHIFFINWDYWFPFYLPKWNMQFDEWLKAPATGHKYTNRLFWWGNFMCTQRRAQGAIYNIDVSLLYDS